MSFALTLASLILALVAIGLTMSSNSDLARNFASLNRVTDQIGSGAERVAAASDGIMKTAEQVSKASAGIVVTTGQVSVASEGLAAEVKSLSTLVSSMGAEVTAASGRVERLIAERFKESEKSAPEAGSPKTENRNIPDLQTFTTRSSSFGVLLLYVAANFFEKQKPLKLIDLSAVINPSSSQVEYFKGFLVACTSCSLLEYKSSNEEIIIMAFPNSNISMIRDQFILRIDREKQTSPNVPFLGPILERADALISSLASA
jgi:hypothetical protein